MAKFLRFIGFMVLALALWQTVSDTFANKAASGGNVVSENTIAVHEQTDAYIAMPQLPYLPDAELHPYCVSGKPYLSVVCPLHKWDGRSYP